MDLFSVVYWLCINKLIKLFGGISSLLLLFIDDLNSHNFFHVNSKPPYRFWQGYILFSLEGIFLNQNWFMVSRLRFWHLQPSKQPISKCSWRTNQFCLIWFLCVTLSAALHRGGLVSAGLCLTAANVPALSVQVSNVWQPLFFFNAMLQSLWEKHLNVICD